MTVETVHTSHPSDYDDVILFYVIGVFLLVLLPTKSKPLASAAE